MLEFLGCLVFGTLLAWILLIIVEGCLASFWAPFYFRTGIKIYRRTYLLPGVTDISASFQYVRQNIKGDLWCSSVEVYKIGLNLYTFRYVLSEFQLDGRQRDWDVTHRIIRFNPETGEMDISGYLDWGISPIFASFAIGTIGMWSQRQDFPEFFQAFLFVCLIISLLIAIGAARGANVNKEVGEYIVQYFQENPTKSESKQPQP